MAGETDAALMAAARELDPKNESGLLERVVIAEFNSLVSADDLPAVVTHLRELDGFGILDREAAMELYFYGALYSWRYLENPGDARMFALKLEALEPENPNAMNLINDLFDDIGREAGEASEEHGEEEGEDEGHGDHDH